MPHSNLLTRAKQGDVDAIAHLLAHALRPQQVLVKGRLEGACLYLFLEFAEPLDQSATIALIEKGMDRLQPRKIQSVKVHGRIVGSAKLAWSSFFPIEIIDGQEKQGTISSPLGPKEISFPSAKEASPPLKVTPSPLIDSPGWGALMTGLILGMLLFFLPLLKVVFRGFLVLVHEIGHAITHWVFGRPAIPAVNLLHGGGITLHFEQVPLLLVLIYAGIGWLFYWQRLYPRRLGVLAVGTVLYTSCLLTPTNLMLAVFMGHGMELVAIAVCLFLSASGYFCRFTGDRTIYAMLGFFTLFNDIEFAWKLNHDFAFRDWYESGIGGAIDNDFVILANQYWNVNLSMIANGFLLACLTAPAVAVLFLYLLQQRKRSTI